MLRYRTPGGSTELALIEWKYTESYPLGGRLSGSTADHARRLGRYRQLMEKPAGPIRLHRGVEYEDLFFEPTYQLTRQQLLAWRIEDLGELDVT